MSSATPAQAKQIMNAVSVLQKFAKTGKVGAAEPMDAKKRAKKPAKGGKKPAAKKATGGKKTKKTSKK